MRADGNKKRATPTKRRLVHPHTRPPPFPTTHPPPLLPPSTHTHTTQVVLTKPVPNLGAPGDLVTVPLGFARNFLKPNRLASDATRGVVANIERAAAAAVAAAEAEKDKAAAMATALATIGKFVIKKKGGEGDTIFGAVTAADIVDAVAMQTGKTLDKRALSVPDIKATGTYDVSVKLHPAVTGTFKVVVQREKQA